MPELIRFSHTEAGLIMIKKKGMLYLNSKHFITVIWRMYFVIWRHIYCYMETYIVIWRHVYCYIETYIVIWSHVYCYMETCLLLYGDMYNVIWSQLYYYMESCIVTHTKTGNSHEFLRFFMLFSNSNIKGFF